MLHVEIRQKNMSGLPWIAAMAFFFMQALDATILNTALPDIAKALIILLSLCNQLLSAIH